MLEGDAGLEEARGVGERLELFVGGHHAFIAIEFLLFASGIDDDFWKETGSMEVEVGVEIIGVITISCV